MTMKHLFSELDVAGLRLTNRIVLPPMATEQADAEGHPSPAAAGRYGSLAATGVALVVVEHSYVAPEGRASPRQMSLASDTCVAGHAAIATAIHTAGALCAAQISHAGSNRRAEMPGRCIGPTAVENPVSHLVPEEMSKDDIVATIRAFGTAAARVQGAGYDLVEVHCAHGYLLGQFLSPLTNHRTDAYGGTPAKRRRLLPEGVEAARALDDAGVAILDLSAGICGSRPAELTGEAYYRPFAEAVSAAVHCHVVCTGGITQPKTAEEIIQNGAADLVGVARAIAADHDWVRKAREATAH